MDYLNSEPIGCQRTISRMFLFVALLFCYISQVNDQRSCFLNYIFHDEMGRLERIPVQFLGAFTSHSLLFMEPDHDQNGLHSVLHFHMISLKKRINNTTEFKFTWRDKV